MFIVGYNKIYEKNKNRSRYEKENFVKNRLKKTEKAKRRDKNDFISRQQYDS